MYGNNLSEISRLVSYKPNDCLQITFQNECAKRHMLNVDQNRRHVTNVAIRKDCALTENGKPYTNVNSKNRDFTNFSRTNWNKNPPSTGQQHNGSSNTPHHFRNHRCSQNNDDFQPTRNFTHFPAFSAETAPHRRGSSLQHSRPNPHRASPFHNTINDTATRSPGPQCNNHQPRSNNPRRLPLSHPSRFLEEPYRDLKPNTTSASARSTKRAPSPVDIHLPPPSVLAKQQPPTGRPSYRQSRGSQTNSKQWSREGNVDTTESHKHTQFRDDIAREPNAHSQRFTRTIDPDNSAHGGSRDNWQTNHRGFGPRRGRGTASGRVSRGTRQQQYHQHNNYYEPQTSRTHNVPSARWKSGRGQEARPPPSPFTDEYIDDFTPEDLAKYKLEIDMENICESPDRKQPSTSCSAKADCNVKHQTDADNPAVQESHQINWNRRYPSRARSCEEKLDCNLKGHDSLWSSKRISCSCPGVLADCMGEQVTSVDCHSTVSLPERLSACRPETGLFHSRSCSQLKG